MLIGEAKTLHFDDFGTSGPVTKPQDHVFLSLETPGHPTKIEKNHWNISKNIILINLKMLDTQDFVNFGKDGRRQIMKNR